MEQDLMMVKSASVEETKLESINKIKINSDQKYQYIQKNLEPHQYSDMQLDYQMKIETNTDNHF